MVAIIIFFFQFRYSCFAIGIALVLSVQRSDFFSPIDSIVLRVVARC